MNQIGFPRWDKAIKLNGSNTPITITEPGIRQTNSESSVYGSDVYYIPFVRDSDNYVNATMTISISHKDTSIGYKCDWQYTQLQNNPNSSNDEAEYFATFFMYMTKNVFGTNKFKILDKTIFRSNGHDPLDVSLKTNSNRSTNNIASAVDICQDVTVFYQYCPYIKERGFCRVGESFCDLCSECLSSIGSYSYTYCLQGWADTGGGNGGDGSMGNGFSTSSGNTSGGNSTPPNPCGGSSTPLEGTQGIKSGSGNMQTFNLPCNPNPGWIPILRDQEILNEIQKEDDDADSAYINNPCGQTMRYGNLAWKGPI